MPPVAPGPRISTAPGGVVSNAARRDQPHVATNAATNAATNTAAPLTNLADELVLPIVDDVPALDLASDALHAAVVHRQIIGLIGEKGLGKSVAMDQVVADFRADENRRRASDRRLIVQISAPDTRLGRFVHLIAAVYREVTGDEMETREKGRTVEPDLLVQRLVAEMQNARCVALVVDNGEQLNGETLRALVSLVDTALRMDKARYRHAPTPDGGVAAGVRAAGLGVVVIGTDDLEATLALHEEAGHRIPVTHRVGAVPATLTAQLYRRFLPCCDQEARRRGDAEWCAFIERFVAQRPVPVRAVTYHVREYVRRMVNHDPTVTTPAAVPWREDLFLQVWRDRLRRAPGSERGNVRAPRGTDRA